jgi:hypothetical protein
MLQAAHDTYGLDIWITEFAVWNYTATSDTVGNFLQTLISTFKYDPDFFFVKRYAWMNTGDFPNNPIRASALFTIDGELTELGRIYASM